MSPAKTEFIEIKEETRKIPKTIDRIFLFSFRFMEFRKLFPNLDPPFCLEIYLAAISEVEHVGEALRHGQVIVGQALLQCELNESSLVEHTVTDYLVGRIS